MKLENRTFLDYNATTPIYAEVLEEVANAYKYPLNPSSTHAFGAEGKKLLRDARDRIAKALGAEGARIIFTSSGTESNNMALRSIKGVSKILMSSIEHDSILKPASYLNSAFINVDSEGRVDATHLKRECEQLKNNNIKYLASIIHSNNETGVVQDVKSIAPVIYENGGYFHIDASQSVGKINFNFNELNVDMATISSHKLGGPKGVAALIVKSGLEVQPLLYGGGQEGYLRAGTENLPAIVGFAKAVELSVDKLNEYNSHTKSLRDEFESKLKSLSDDVIIFSAGAERLPNTSNFSLPNCDNETTLIDLDLNGFAVSAGSACSSGRVVTSHVLSAMGVKDKVAKTALRLSIGLQTKSEDIDNLYQQISKIFARKALKNVA